MSYDEGGVKRKKNDEIKWDGKKKRTEKGKSANVLRTQTTCG